jgi:hypothetical protein
VLIPSGQLIKRFEGNFSLSYLVKYAFDSFSSEQDAQDVEKYFKDKDNSKYNLALAQVRWLRIVVFSRLSIVIFRRSIRSVRVPNGSTVLMMMLRNG